ncbi:MAG TPA: MFS transporter [Methylomusa anaerophila]|uniref:Inner membrane transport protein YnfM n=1 Tax=Methylomusa anaerophila TaxID=1930071 RepID=A0A348AGL4_9FIRM|nr:MFS transporter [Methylomusa anaerophila]BBB90212.1 inner membrane transport protein YnfM [Methylomusa anaerophila]HML90734.1 MFS transporter [Methylomusa anaerophila]
MELLYNPAKKAFQGSSQSYSLMTVVLFWSGLVIMSSLYITIPLISTFTDIFKVAPTQAAWTSSSFSFCFALGCLFYGPLSDRFGRKIIILSGLSILAFISLLMGFITDLSWLILFRGLQGAAAATFSPVALAYVVEVFPPQKQVTTIGFINTGFLMAGIIGQIFSSYISQLYGWNLIFYLLGVIYAVTAFLILWFIPQSPVTCVNTSIITIFRQMGTILTQKSLLCSYAIALTILFSFVGMYTALNHYLSSPLFGFTAQQIFYVRSMGIIGMLLSPFSGQLVEKHGLFSVLRAGMALSIIGLLLLGISNNLLLIVVASILFIAGLAVFAPTVVAIIGRLGGKVRGAAISAYTFILFAGASIGPILTLNILKSGSYFFTFLALAFFLCFGLLASFFIRMEDEVKEIA